jgi:hypothetical protein
MIESPVGLFGYHIGRAAVAIKGDEGEGIIGGWRLPFDFVCSLDQRDAWHCPRAESLLDDGFPHGLLISMC